MAINKNHEFEEVNGIKCSIVEKNATEARVAFLKKLLEYNRFEVVVGASAPAKPAKGAVAETTEEPKAEGPSSFTVGVTNLLFNPVNAVYGRLLKTPDGHFVTPAYWQQQETVSHDEVPYYEKKG